MRAPPWHLIFSITNTDPPDIRKQPPSPLEHDTRVGVYTCAHRLILKYRADFALVTYV